MPRRPSGSAVGQADGWDSRGVTARSNFVVETWGSWGRGRSKSHDRPLGFAAHEAISRGRRGARQSTRAPPSHYSLLFSFFFFFFFAPPRAQALSNVAAISSR